MAGDSGVDVFCFLRGGEGRGEVVEPGVGAAMDRFCVVVGGHWALPVLGDVCAVADRACVGVGGATGNVSVLGDAVSVIGRASGELLAACQRRHLGVRERGGRRFVVQGVRRRGLHLQNARRVIERDAMRRKMPRNCQRRRLRSFRETVPPPTGCILPTS